MIDYEKYAKFGAAAPRYTSYPTAPEFHEQFDQTQLEMAITRSNNSGRAISLYFHLPFCRSACYFCGCNVIYTSKNELKDEYISLLEKELNIYAQFLDVKRTVNQIHFGGGTPTFFDADQLAKIIKLIRKTFPNISNECEFGVEIDPRFFTENQMKVFAEYGVNRISFGVQDFDPKVQEAVHRIQDYDCTKKAVDLVRKYGIKSVNIDLIYGLPFQHIDSFENTIKTALELSSDRVALFNYAHVPWMKKTMRKIDETTLPAPREKLQMLKRAIELFANGGLEMIGMDHFAKKEDELTKALREGKLHRNFQGYTTHSECDLFGFGVTSISEGADFYAQHFRELDRYKELISAGKPPLMRGITLTADDILRKTIIMQLMSNFYLDFSVIEQQFNIDFLHHFANELNALKTLENEGLCTTANGAISVSETGKLLIRNIAMAFDSRLQKTPKEQRKFSQSV